MGRAVVFHLSRRSRPVDCAQAAVEVVRWMEGLEVLDARLKCWSALDRAFQPRRIRTTGDMERIFVGSMASRRRDERRMATHSATISCSAGASRLLFARLQVWTNSAPEGPKVTVEVTLHDALLPPGTAWPGRARELFAATVRAFEPDTGTCAGALPGSVLLPSDGCPAAGWFTYLSQPTGPLPSFPPSTTVFPVGDLGWIIVAQNDPIDPSSGLSGPPERGAGAPLIEQPSYLKAPSPAEPANPGAGSLATGTGEVDIAAIFRAAVPFGKGTGAAMIDVAAQSAPPEPGGDEGSPAPEPSTDPPVPGFGQTETFEMGDLLKRGPAVPFRPRGRGRWVRFNPQTGEPLAAPYWEELPGVEEGQGAGSGRK